MENFLKYKILRLILDNLNGLDLYNASKVCRSWFECAQFILKEREPTCISRKYDAKHLRNWDAIKREIIDCCKGKPSIHMFFTAVAYMSQLPKGCICQYLPLNCYSISMEKYHFHLDDNTVMSMFFPEVPEIKIATVTLNWHHMDKGIYCEELKCLIDKSSNAEKLKNVFESIFNNDLSTESCMILFYDSIGIGVIHYLMKILKNWFPRQRVTIWGGLVYRLSICNFVQTSRICQSFVDCTCILMTGIDMKSWSVVLNSHDDIGSFEEFKNVVKLKKHSIGFMATPYEGYYDHEYEIAFKKSFPNLPLFIIYDSDPLAAEYLEDIYLKNNQLPLFEITEITFMILTYN